MSEWSNDDLHSVLTEIATRACVDMEFRSIALADPGAAIAIVSGRAAPRDRTFRFFENTKDQTVLILPNPSPDLAALPESELLGVAQAGVSVTWPRG